MMNSKIGGMAFAMRVRIAMLGLCAAAAPAGAQWWDVCFDPTNTMPLSPDWAVVEVGNSLIVGGVGFSGTVTFGPDSPCGEPPGQDAKQTRGCLTMRAGATGSLHTSEDDFCAITTGAPFGANVWTYATVRVIDADGAIEDTRWAEAGFDLFVGPQASFRRILAMQTVPGGVEAQLVLRSVGPALRYEWTLTNTNDTQVSVGLRHSTWLGMINLSQGFSGFGGNNYVLLPTGRPLLVHKNFVRAADPLNFPKLVDFYFRQAFPYPAIRVLTGPDASHPDQATANRLVIGDWLFVNGAPLWNSVVLPDAAISDTTFAVFFDPVTVPAGQSRRIIYYLEAPWAVSDLSLIDQNGRVTSGYALAAEAPRILAFDEDGLNELDPNPFYVTAWVDNQYAFVGEGITMTDINLTLTLPLGLSFAPGETQTKNIASLGPNELREVRWQVQADGSYSGPLTYRVQCSPHPGRAKTVEGTVNVSLTPKVNIVAGPQGMTFPWRFANDFFTAIFAPIDPGDFFYWNVPLQSYETAERAQRGRGFWLVGNGKYENVMLNGASPSGGEVEGGFAFLLRKGWNFIGVPVQYVIQLNQMLATSSAIPDATFRWSDLTSRGWVRSTVYWYNPDTSSYEFSSDPSQLLMPGRAYWFLVNAEAPIELHWPPVFSPGLPGSFRGRDEWVMSDRRWRLQFVARGEGGSDAGNYLGVAENAAQANELSVPEPPMAPASKFQLSFLKADESGGIIRWAQDIRENRGRATYEIEFSAQQAGTYSLTWPNISQLPRTVGLRMTDLQTGQVRDLRMNSGFSFTMSAPGVRKFKLSVERATAGRPVIGAVTVVSSGRDRNAAVTIQYSLSTNAQTSIRILSAAGKEVMAITRGRADGAGANSATWNKRDKAGRSVAPGNYIVEILAETAEGQRARVTRPVVVVR